MFITHIEIKVMTTITQKIEWVDKWKYILIICEVIKFVR